MKKYVAIDFEFNQTTNPDVNLVCCSYDIIHDGDVVHSDDVWFFNRKDNEQHFYVHQLMKSYLEDDYVFLSYSSEAEARSFLSLNLNPTKFKWIDLFTEYKNLLNHYHKWQYGKQLIRGEVKNTFPPELYGSKGVSNEKPEMGLAAAVFKVLNERIDTKEKEDVRAIIIRNNPQEIEENRERIQTYCRSDIKYLYKLLMAFSQEYAKRYAECNVNHRLKSLKSEMLLRGEYGARTALMVRLGYPVNLEQCKNFSESVEDILSEVARDINDQFPEIRPFTYDYKDMRHKMNQKTIQAWIKNDCPYHADWLKTPTGKYSLKLEEWEKAYDFRHNFPRGNFGAQIVRYLKTKQAMNGFRKPLSFSEDTKWFFDAVGPDGMVRSYLNPYGSQAGRSQPSATSFIPLKSAWMRSLIQPPSGMCIYCLDYTSEEFLLSALISGDKKMIEAFMTGDVYLHFAKEVGMIPPEGTKKTHPIERQACKSTVLGLSYMMSKVGLAKKLTNDTGHKWTEEQAQDLIDKFNRAYPQFYEYKCKITGGWEFEYNDDGEMIGRDWRDGVYKRQGMLWLPCGWTLFKDNKNLRSVGNFTIQGFASSIMRMAVRFAQDRGLDIIFTLHDALYGICKIEDKERCISILADSMMDGFTHYFEGQDKEYAKGMKLDGECWGPDLEEGSTVINGAKVKYEKIHIDERGEEEYHKLKKYLDRDSTVDIL